MHKSRGRRWQRAARGACLRASAIAGAAGLGGAMRANGAPTRPQAASGGMGAERPMRARGEWRRRGAGCAVRKRSAAAADRAPPSPALGYAFPVWAPKGREGDGGSERSERRGKGERAATRRARIKARPLGRASAYPIGWAGWGMVPARQVGPRQKTSTSARLGLYRGPAGRLSLPRYGTRMAKSSPAPRCAPLIASQMWPNSAGIGPRIAWADFSDQIHKAHKIP